MTKTLKGYGGHDWQPGGRADARIFAHSPRCCSRRGPNGAQCDLKADPEFADELGRPRCRKHALAETAKIDTVQ